MYVPNPMPTPSRNSTGSRNGGRPLLIRFFVYTRTWRYHTLKSRWRRVGKATGLLLLIEHPPGRLEEHVLQGRLPQIVRIVAQGVRHALEPVDVVGIEPQGPLRAVPPDARRQLRLANHRRPIAHRP